MGEFELIDDCLTIETSTSALRQDEEQITQLILEAIADYNEVAELDQKKKIRYSGYYETSDLDELEAEGETQAFIYAVIDVEP